jgi:hypothetical protein
MRGKVALLRGRMHWVMEIFTHIDSKFPLMIAARSTECLVCSLACSLHTTYSQTDLTECCTRMAKPQEQMLVAPKTAPGLTDCRKTKSVMLESGDQSDPLLKELAELAEFIKSQGGVLIP